MAVSLTSQHHLPMKAIMNPSILMTDVISRWSTEDWLTSPMASTTTDVRNDRITSDVSHIALFLS